MKKLTIVFPEERIVGEIRLCSSHRAMRRHWLRIGGDPELRVDAFACRMHSEGGLRVVAAYFHREAVASLLAHELTHLADFLWECVKRRRTARGKAEDEFRAYVAGVIADGYSKWDRTGNLLLESTGLWEGL